MAARRPRSPAASGRGRDAASPRSRRKATGDEAKAGPKTERATGASQSPAPRTRARAAGKPRAPAEPARGTATQAADPVKPPRDRAKPSGGAAKRARSRPKAPPVANAPHGGAGGPDALPPREVVAATPALVGRVVHAYGRAGAARVALTGELRAGDAVAVRGATTDFCARVGRLERRGRPVAKGRAGEEIGVALPARVRGGDRVFRLEPSAP